MIRGIMRSEILSAGKSRLLLVAFVASLQILCRQRTYVSLFVTFLSKRQNIIT